MKTNKHILLVLCVLGLASCKVDDRYNADQLSKVDTSMRIFEEGLSLPVGYTAPITLDNAFRTKNEQGEMVYPKHFGADGKGNYYIDYDGDAGTYDFEIPQVGDFGHPSIDPIRCSIKNPLPGGGTFPLTPGTYDFPKIDTCGVLQFSNNLGENILDIKTIDVESDVILNLGTENISGDLYVKAESFIQFPIYLKISKNDSSTDYEIQDGNKVYFKNNFLAPNGKLTMKLTVMDIAKAKQLGKVTIDSNNKLTINDEIKLNITPQINGTCKIENAEVLSLTFTINITAPKIKQAEVQIKASVDGDPSKFDFTLPSNISTESNLDLEDPVITFNLDCNRGQAIVGEPFKFTANLTVCSYTNGGKDVKKSIDIKNVKIKEGENVIIISRLGGKATADNEVDCIVDNLNELFSGTLPDAFGVSKNKIEIINKDDQGKPIYYTVNPTLRPTIDADYVFKSYLQFRKNSSLGLNLPVSDVKIDLSSLKPKNLYLDFDFENAVPLKMYPDLIITILDGGKSRDIHVFGDNMVIEPGNPSVPSSTHIRVKIDSENGYIEAISAIKVQFRGDVVDETVTLNGEQYIRLNKLAIGLTGGVNLTIKE